MKGYFTTDDSSITIEANPAGIRLYNTSKKAIEDNSKQIDSFIKLYLKLLKLTDFGTNINLEVAPVINKEDNIKFIEIYCNFLDSTTELSISSRELYIAKNKTEQIYYIKNIYLNIARYIERMKTQNQFLHALATSYDCLSLFHAYTQANRDFNTRYGKEITDNRNKIIAHFDKGTSYTEYYRTTLNYDAEAIAQMTIQFMDVQKLLANLLSELSPKLLLKLYANSEKLEQQRQDSKQSLYDTIERLKGTPAYDFVKGKLDEIYEKVDNLIK